MAVIIRLTPTGPVSFKRRSLEPATESYLTSDDVVRFGVRSSKAPLVVFRARVQLPSGDIAVFEQSLQITSETDHDVQFRMVEGFLLSAAVSTDTDGILRGECYAWAHIISTGAGDQTPARVLVGDYITSGHSAGWPDSPVNPPGTGPGFVAKLSLAAVAAGEELRFLNTFKRRVRFLSCHALLTTDATAANRQVSWRVEQTLEIVYSSRCVDVQTASLAVLYTFGVGAVDGQIHGLEAAIPAPPGMDLPGDFDIRTKTDNLQAADQWSAFRVLAEQWVLPDVS